MTTLPLTDVQVVTVEQAVSGPLATRHLADWGARITKIERPAGGDFARDYDSAVAGTSSWFAWTNRGKRSLGLDLKDPRGMAVLRELIGRADVFLHNLAPGAAERLGIGPDDLVAEHPELVVCEISGYGLDGPMSDRKAYDLLIQAEAGLLSMTGDGDMMAKAGVSVADIAAAMYACNGVLAALLHRELHGGGSVVRVSMLEALAEWMSAPLYFTALGGGAPERSGMRHAMIVPYGPVHCADGLTVMLAVQSQREWVVFCEQVLGDRGIAVDPRFATNLDRLQHRAELDDVLAERLGTRPAHEVRTSLNDAGIACSEVRNLQDVWNHEQLRARNRFAPVRVPGGVVEALRPPIDFSRGTAPMGDVPALGAHSAEILGELGYSDDDIAELVTDGVTCTTPGAAGDGS